MANVGNEEAFFKFLSLKILAGGPKLRVHFDSIKFHRIERTALIEDESNIRMIIFMKTPVLSDLSQADFFSEIKNKSWFL